MTSNNKPKHLPINHREPTKEELSAQMDREEQQSALVGEVYADISDKQLVNLSKFDRDGRTHQ